MTDGNVIFEVEDGRGYIRLNRPDRLNALTAELMIDLKKALEQAIIRDDVRVIILTGNGNGFCAGQDLAERDPRKLKGPLDLEKIQLDLFHPIIMAMAETKKPVVAAVNGVAAGAGVGLALAADIVIASSAAKFIFSFSKIGLSVDAGIGRSLVNAIGASRAKALLMLGETLAGERAESLGLIWKCLPHDALWEGVEETARNLVATPTTSLAGIKEAIRACELSFVDYLREEARQQGIAGRHPDYAEGVLAFLEKRRPKFS